MRRRPTAAAIAPSTSSCLAGSRSATCTIRRRQRHTSPRSRRSPTNPTSLARGACWAGRAAEAYEQDPGGKKTLPGGSKLSHRLLRPDRPRQSRPRRTCTPMPTRRSPAPTAPLLGDVVRCGEGGRVALRSRCPRSRLGDDGGSRRYRDGRRHAQSCCPELDREISRRPRHAVDRQARTGAQLAGRTRALPDLRGAGLHPRSDRRSIRRWFIPSCGRKAGSIQRRCRAPMRSA